MKLKKNMNQFALIIIFAFACLLIVLPFFLMLSISLSNEADISKYGYSFIPRDVNFSAYKYIFENPKSIIDAYKVTAIFSVASMILTVLFTAHISYPLSKKGFRARKYLSFYLYFTMLFSGGLVPTYILITRYLHLNNTIFVYILPTLVSAWNVFMMRTFFSNIPEEICEAAFVDGAGEYMIFWRIVLPLSKPVLATIALTTFLAKWNDWNTAMLYIDDESLISLQYLLQRILSNIQMLQQTEDTVNRMVSVKDIPTETVRMAMAIVVAGPVLFAFPFFQKYFVKGLTVGGVKG